MITRFRKFISIICIASIGGLTAIEINKITEKENSIDSNEKTPVKFVKYPSSVPEIAIDFTTAAEMTVHSVVHVKTFYTQNYSYNPFYSDPFRDFFGDRGFENKPRTMEASGSGVIMSDDGYIVTNNHVVQNAEKVEVTLNDKRTYEAKVIGTDPSTDLALLKIDEKNLSHVTYGNSDEVKIGEWVLAVGNPFNLNSTVTAGIVSAKARNINILSANNATAIESFIQTDAAVNPGNSGGALVNIKGELIGINSAIASNTGSYTGYSFAIPVNIVKKVTTDLLEYGEVQRGFIGVQIQDLDARLAEEKGIKNTLQGVYVNGVSDGGAAEEAGIKSGDIITKIENVTVNTTPELQEQVSRFRPGDKINVSIVRNGSEKIIPVILKNKNGNTEIVKKEDLPEIISLLGADFETLSSEEKDRLKIDYGIKISKLIGGKLRSAGIREGFIITSIDQKPIRTTDDLVKALQNKKGGVLIEGLYPNGMRAYYGFGL